MGLSSPAGDQAANRVLPRQVRFEHMKGANVNDAQNRSVATVEDIVLNRDGRIAAVVVEVGGFLGFGGKNVGLSANELKMTRDDGGKPRFQVDMTKDQLKSAQAFDLTPKSTATGTTTPPAGSSPVR